MARISEQREAGHVGVRDHFLDDLALEQHLAAAHEPRCELLGSVHHCHTRRQLKQDPEGALNYGNGHAFRVTIPRAAPIAIGFAAMRGSP